LILVDFGMMLGDGLMDWRLYMANGGLKEVKYGWQPVPNIRVHNLPIYLGTLLIHYCKERKGLVMTTSHRWGDWLGK